MVFGDVRREHIQLNEDTVWSGEKRDRSNPEAPKAIPEIRRLLEQGHPAEAQNLADRAMISVPRELPVYQRVYLLLISIFSYGVDVITPRNSHGSNRAARRRPGAKLERSLQTR